MSVLADDVDEHVQQVASGFDFQVVGVTPAAVADSVVRQPYEIGDAVFAAPFEIFDANLVVKALLFVCHHDLLAPLVGPVEVMCQELGAVFVRNQVHIAVEPNQVRAVLINDLS